MPLYEYITDTGEIHEVFRRVEERDDMLIIDGMTCSRLTAPSRIGVCIAGTVIPDDDPAKQARASLKHFEEQDPNFNRSMGFTKKELKETWAS